MRKWYKYKTGDHGDKPSNNTSNKLSSHMIQHPSQNSNPDYNGEKWAVNHYPTPAILPLLSLSLALLAAPQNCERLQRQILQLRWTISYTFIYYGLLTFWFVWWVIPFCNRTAINRSSNKIGWFIHVLIRGNRTLLIRICYRNKLQFLDPKLHSTI